MSLTVNIFANALSIKNLVEKVEETKDGMMTFLDADSCIDTGAGTGFISQIN